MSQLAQKNGNGPLWHIFTISTFGFGMDCYYFIHNSHWPSRANSLIARSIYGWISSVPPKLCKHSGLWNSARVPWYHNFGVMVLVGISWQTLALKTHDSNLIFDKIHFFIRPKVPKLYEAIASISALPVHCYRSSSIYGRMWHLTVAPINLESRPGRQGGDFKLRW